jgi:hypothetical protein
MQVDGTCHCGELAWEATIDPQAVMICHCTDCQIMGGGAFQWGVLVPVGDFRLTRGEPRGYLKQGTSGAMRRVAFCGTCSSTLYGADAETPQKLSLRLSGCRQARELVPSFQLWRASAFAWLGGIEDIAGFDAQPAGLVDRGKAQG